MPLEPSTVGRLIKTIDFSSDYEHVVLFDSPDEQYQYFAAKEGKAFSRNSYVRVNSRRIKLSMKFGDVCNYSYLMFRNAEHDTRWWYAFIDSVEYINEASVEITFSLDVMQSYMFDYELGECFVEREHSVTDVIGENIVAEDIEIGPYVFGEGVSPIISDDRETNNSGQLTMNDLCLVMVYNPALLDIDRLANLVSAKIWAENIYSGVYQGVRFAVFDVFESAAKAADFIKEADNVMTCLNTISFGGFICAFMYPRMFIPDTKYWDEAQYDNTRVHMFLNRPTSFSGYVPKNNKLYTAPYMMATLSNHRGNAKDFAFELCGNATDDTTDYGKMGFCVEGNLSVTPGVMAYPMLYLGHSLYIEGAVTIDDYPQATWGADGLTEWASNNLFRTALMAGAIGAVGGVGATATALPAASAPAFSEALIAKAKGAGAAFSRVTSSPPIMAATADALYSSTTKGHVYGSGAGDVVFGNASGREISARIKRITEANARRIDKYLSRYGYATRAVKVPNRDSRPYWNYVKTKGAVVVSAKMPATVCDVIRAVYDSGVTFWRANAVIGDYTNQDNSV